MPEAQAQLVRTTPAGAERSLLSGVRLFEGLPAEELSTLELACRYRRFSALEMIVDQESPSTDVFFVVRGRVRVVSYSLAGREIAFADLAEGTCFGELAAIDGRPRAASVIATTDSLIVALPARVFLNLLAEKPVIARRVLVRLAAIIRAADERILELSTLAAISRVQAELLRQVRVDGGAANAGVIEPIPVHSDIASRVSTTRETVARVLNDLARKGIVERTRSALLIRDLSRLRQMVEDVRG